MNDFRSPLANDLPRRGAAAALVKRRTPFALRGLKSAGFGVVIGVCLWGMSTHTLASTLVYAVCIATSCWFFIDVGRTCAVRWLNRGLAAGCAPEQSQWPGWRWMLVVIPLGTVAGYTLGNGLADLITGHHQPGYWRNGPLQAISLLLGSLVPGLAITYWFYSRETMAAQQMQVETAQRQAAENQLKLLEAQLEPHMLFNTLANLRVLIGLDPPRAQAMLDQLIDFLRATLSASRTTAHSLEAEFARLADYLALIQVRMGDRLQTRFELPPALAASLVPPLLLQPLVENAVLHGLEPQVAGGRIEIAAAQEGGDLVLRVRDTGAGLGNGPGDSARSTGGTSFGLAQVKERLATLYGQRASFDLAAAPPPGGGTLATIRMPL